MGLLIAVEFVGATFGGAWAGMRFHETPFWAIAGWFIGMAVFAVPYSTGALLDFNAGLLA